MGVDFRTVLFGTFCSGLIPSGSDAAGIGIAGTFVVFDIIVVAGFFDQAGFIKGFPPAVQVAPLPTLVSGSQ